eukprot:1814176-Rhodomonas_salina.2
MLVPCNDVCPLSPYPICYAISGTDIAYRTGDATTMCYAVSSTDIAYATPSDILNRTAMPAIGVSCHALAMQSPVLTYAMLLRNPMRSPVLT